MTKRLFKYGIIFVTTLSLLLCSGKAKVKDNIFKEIASEIIINQPVDSFFLVIGLWKSIVSGITIGHSSGSKYDKNFVKYLITDEFISIETNFLGCSSNNAVCCWGKSVAKIHDPAIRNLALRENIRIETAFTDCPPKISGIDSEYNLSPTSWIFVTDLTYIIPDYERYFVDKTTIFINSKIGSKNIFNLSKLGNDILIRAMGELSSPVTNNINYTLISDGILFNISNGVESYQDGLTAPFNKMSIDGSIIRKYEMGDSIRTYVEKFENFSVKVYSLDEGKVKILGGTFYAYGHKIYLHTEEPILIEYKNRSFRGKLILTLDNRNFVFLFDKNKLIILSEDGEKIEYSSEEIYEYDSKSFEEFFKYWWL